MRGRIICAALVLLSACARGDGGDEGVVSSLPAGVGPDPIVLRFARHGGTVRAYRYPRLDSLLWSSTQSTGAVTSILAFDAENGIVAYQDAAGYVGWVDLRVGTVTPAARVRLAGAVSLDAWAVYGTSKDSSVARLTPTADWTWHANGEVTHLFPTPDGSLDVIVSRDSALRAFRLRPPEKAISDSAGLPWSAGARMSPLGDRLYLASGRDLVAVDAGSFAPAATMPADGEIVAFAPTPSGDRIFVAARGRDEVAIIDRYSGERSSTVRLPGTVRALRMDPLGRYVLAQPDTGDSAWAISVGTGSFVGTLPTAWREDLPAVAVDGSVATVDGKDVAFIVPGQRKPRILVREGASDLWDFVYWNGFRPRAKGLDQPVVFDEDTSAYGYARMRQDSAVAPPPTPESTLVTRPAAPVDTAVAEPVRGVWTVSFAAVLSEPRAQDLAKSITVDGQHARVVLTLTDGVRVYRVVLGPYRDRAQADRVGRDSGHSYWVFEGLP